MAEKKTGTKIMMQLLEPKFRISTIVYKEASKHFAYVFLFKKSTRHLKAVRACTECTDLISEIFKKYSSHDLLPLVPPAKHRERESKRLRER
jgi:hypothetical protein